MRRTVIGVKPVIVTGDHETGYLTGPGSDPAWMPLVNNGAGYLPGMEWHSGDHTIRSSPSLPREEAQPSSEKTREC